MTEKKLILRERTSASINVAAEYQAADTTEGLLFSQTASCVHTFKQQALVAYNSFSQFLSEMDKINQK